MIDEASRNTYPAPPSHSEWYTLAGSEANLNRRALRPVGVTEHTRGLRLVRRALFVSGLSHTAEPKALVAARALD
eukprot:324402-Rhodomonas_salina.1